MLKILKSKKGQIPTTDVFGIIINGIRSFISWFIAVIPKPLLAIIFLFFILFIANFAIPLFANSLGYHCDTNGQVWKISGEQIFTSIDLYRTKPDLNGANYQNIPFMCMPKIEARHLSLCSNCTYQNDVWGTCATDGYRLSDYNGVIKGFYCNWLGCAPPESYFLNITEQKFQCNDDSCINKTLEEYNSKLYEIEGATPIYFKEADNRSVNQMIYFKCQNENPTNIRLTLFGIDVFNYKIWVVLFIIGALLYIISIKK